MSDPGKTISASVRYEVRLAAGPYSFRIDGVEHKISEQRDAVVLVRRVATTGGRIMEEKIVGVIGDECESGCAEMLRIREFLNDGGVIGLGRDLLR